MFHTTTLFPLLIALSVGIYTPMSNDILFELNTSEFFLQLAITLFLVTVALCGRYLSPFASKLSAHKLALASALIFITGSLLCFFSWSIKIFILGRVIQAVGATGALTISFSWRALALAFFLSPTIGSFMYWRSTFLLMAFLSIFALAFSFLLKEPAVKSRLRLTSIHTVTAGLGVITIVGYLSIAPYIFSDLLLVPLHQFGLYFGSPVIFYLAGLLIHRKLSIEPNLTLGTLFVATAGITMLALYLAFGLTPISFLLPMGFAILGATLLLHKTTGGPLALLGSIIITPLTAWGVSSPLPLAFTLIISSTTTLVCSYYALRENESVTSE